MKLEVSVLMSLPVLLLATHTPARAIALLTGAQQLPWLLNDPAYAGCACPVPLSFVKARMKRSMVANKTSTL